MTQPMFYIAFTSREEVVNDGDLVTLKHKFVYQMGAHKPSSTRHLFGE